MGGTDVLSSVVSSQIDLHAQFGGVVPEIASRAHVELIMPVVARAIVEAGVDDARIDAVAATIGPGLIGSLLVGVSAAKALALAWGVPFVGVNHLEAHLYAAFLEEPDLELPLVVLLVSGGHTMLVEMGTTAGTGCSARRSTTPPARPSTRSPATSASATPAGPAIDALAMEGDPAAVAFPRAMLHEGLDFSFCGLKTAGDQPRAQAPRGPDRRRGGQLPAGRGRRAGDQGAPGRRAGGRQGPGPGRRGRRQLAAAGAAAGGLRPGRPAGFLPSRAMCTDNAAMIAAAGWHRCASTARRRSTDGADPNLRLRLAG